MNTKTDQNIQRVIEFAAILVVIGIGLNLLVMQTLGAFDAGAVILGLFLGFWSLLLGTVTLAVSSGWFFLRKKHASGNLAEAHAPLSLHEVGRRRFCTMH
jgi:hypothetical protein